MTHNEYNGWWNYETWVVNLWMDNDQGSQELWREQAAGAIETDGEEAVFSLADLLKDHHKECANDLLDEAKAGSSVWADLLGAALSEVNWEEIASHLIESAKESAKS